jgi:hypothetical protein
MQALQSDLLAENNPRNSKGRLRCAGHLGRSARSLAKEPAELTSQKIIKAISIRSETSPIEDLFELAKKTRQQAAKIVGHSNFRILPEVHYSVTAHLFLMLVEYERPMPQARSLAETMQAIAKSS